MEIDTQTAFSQGWDSASKLACRLDLARRLGRQNRVRHLQHHLARWAWPTLALQKGVRLARLLQWKGGADAGRAQGAGAEQAGDGAQPAAVGVHADHGESRPQAQQAFDVPEVHAGGGEAEWGR